MEERGAIRLLLLLGAAGVLLQAAATYTFVSSTPDAVRNFVLPAACMKVNSTYALSMPLDLRSCRRVLDLSRSVDKEGLGTLCSTLEGEDADACSGIAALYGKRVQDCVLLAEGLLKIEGLNARSLSRFMEPHNSSVSYRDADRACSRLKTRPA